MILFGYVVTCWISNQTEFSNPGLLKVLSSCLVLGILVAQFNSDGATMKQKRLKFKNDAMMK